MPEFSFLLHRFRFRVLFVHLIPCTMLVVLNILLFRTMKEAERKRERLLNCRQKKAAAGESKESKKLRDSNCTTLMLIVVITVRKDRTTGPGKKVFPRLREFCRQGQAEVVSKSRNKILATWEPPFCRTLYRVSVCFYVQQCAASVRFN